MALEGQVSLPGGGKVSRKAAAGGLVVVATLIGVYYYRKRTGSSAAATAAPAAAGQYPPDGTTGNPSDPYSTDPATGQTYGNEMAGAGTLGAFGSGAASGMYYDPATGAYDLTSPYGTQATPPPYQTQGGPPFANNSAWSDWVIQELQAQNPSLNTGALIEAIGLYLNGQPVTAAQKTLIFEATAIGGDPPVAGANGYPPRVRTSGNGGHATVIVPKVVGEAVTPALAKLKADHLAGKTNMERQPGKDYQVTSQLPAAGRRVAEGSTVVLTIREKTGGGGGKPPRKVKIPVTYGDRADPSIARLEAAGLKVKIEPARQPGKSYWSYGTTPKGGTEVNTGTTVIMNVAPGPPGTNFPQGKGG